MAKILSQIDTPVSENTEKSNPLVDTLELIESNTEVKSFVYQQINELTPFATENTTIMVMARDPQEAYQNEDHLLAEEAADPEHERFTYRIAIVLKEEEGTIEAEGFGYDIYDAVRFAKEALLQRLSEIQEEVESPQDRMNAIQQAMDNQQVH